MFGTVSKTPRYTRFRLEVKLNNGCTIFETYAVANTRLEESPKIYGMVCDMLTFRLDTRIKERHQAWLRE